MSKVKDEETAIPRLKKPERNQVEFRACAWNDLLSDDHQARIVWQYVLGLDLSELYRQIKAVEGHVGQPAIDPRILFALWLYGSLRGIGSARELDRRCDPETGEVPFQWICGGVSVNYHTLADFRTRHVELLDDIFTRSIAALLHEKLVTLDRVAQDGMKVRASAGSASFRRKPTLEQHHAEAKAHIEALKTELLGDPTAANRRQQAARERAARERESRLAKALEHVQEVAARKHCSEDKENARVSMTDPESRLMKMADGGFRPAYNVQLATDAPTQIITGIEVITSGSDRGQLAPMVEQHQERYGEPPKEMLADGGFATKPDITTISETGQTTVYAPVQRPKNAVRDPHTPHPGDSPAVVAWRKRMATDEAKKIYKQRAATAECVNAHARNRGLYQVRVRGAPRVKAVVLWYVLAHNLLRAALLRAARQRSEV